LVEGATILDESGEQDFELSRDAKVHDEIEVGEPVSV